MRPALALLTAVTAFAACPGPSTAAPAAGPDSPLPPAAVSAGQPPRIDFSWGPLAGYDFARRELRTRVFLSATTEPPVLLPRFLGLTLEGALGTCGDRFDAAAAAWLGIPWAGIGVDYDIPDDEWSLRLSLRFPLRRGGMLHHGDLLRFDYAPGAQQVLAGLALPSPFERYRMTRKAAKEVRLPAGSLPEEPVRGAPHLSPELDSLLARVEHAVLWIDRMVTPRFAVGEGFERDAAALREHLRQPGHDFAGEEAAYHDGLAAAFVAALGGDAERGRALAHRAEACIFERVLVPFDQKFGREKEPAGAGGYCARALAEFEAALPGEVEPGDTTAASAGRRALCREVFRRVLAAIERAADQARGRWQERFLFWHDRARLAWLPLNYGLQHDQYDTQAEWDSVLASLTRHPFSDANTIQYLMMERFHIELKRMIRETETYQVTIVHDFRGRESDGTTDIYGWDVVADGYLAAFLRAVRDLDSGRRARLPQFFLFLDAHYYGANRERDIVSYMENLYDPPRLRLQDDQIAAQVEARQDSLRRAIDRSPALARLGRERLRELFRVHVNITYPLDPSFNLDMTQRDHRKLGFRDVSEADPSAGEAVITGQGVGAHYNGSGWEDRSLLVRGSALVTFKTDTRRLFLDQGFSPEEVPECLRAQAHPDDYAERCLRLRADRGWTTPVSIVANETGYGDKQATVLKAAVYNLAADSSTVLSFDSLWLSDLWAGMFIGAALRGARMFPVAPTPQNAPSHAAPVLCFLRQNLDLLFRAQNSFAEEIAAAGGALRVGLYAHDAPTQDFRRRVDAFLKSRASQPVVRRWFPFDAGIDSLLSGFLRQFPEVAGVALSLRPRPYLHLKYQLYGSYEGFRIIERPEWVPILRRHLEIRQRQVYGLKTPGLGPWILSTVDSSGGVTRPLIPAFEQWLAESDPTAPQRVVFTCTIGSQNQNPRSLLLDGEVAVNISGYDGLITTADFIFILGVATWPSTRQEFDRLFPERKLPFYMAPLRRLMKSQS